MTLKEFLFKPIDNSQLVVFRIFYGFLIACEAFGAIGTGWIRKTLIEPLFTFNFIGFDWLQPLPGNGMYIYFAIMGILGILISIGYKYRFSAFAFAIMWLGVYLMQKTSYNNHYYLLALLAFIMALLPANKNLSVDAKLNPSIKSDTMYNYIRWGIIAQLFIVYSYASIAKLYADWMDFSFIEVLLKGKSDYYLIGDFLQKHWVHRSVAIFGICFDLLVVPALLWKPTRKIAFACSLFFHLFNSYVFQIGIFPYLSLAFCVFFFEPKTVRKIFYKGKEAVIKQIGHPKNANIIMGVTITYLVIQLLLPLRHHIIKDDVLWTEEGHRMSWRMMLRTRSGSTQFKVVNKETKTAKFIRLKDYLTKKQMRKVTAYPDFMWQFAQHLKKEHAKNGEDIAVYVTSRISVNGKKRKKYIDSNVDLASVPWQHFSHHEWILPSKEE